MATRRRQEYNGWNGAAVDWGHERMSPEELRSTFLATSPSSYRPSDSRYPCKRSHAPVLFPCHLLPRRGTPHP